MVIHRITKNTIKPAPNDVQDELISQMQDA